MREAHSATHWYLWTTWEPFQKGDVIGVVIGEVENE
jgi:hypothetical protein